VIPKVREGLAVSLQAAQECDVDRFNLRKLSVLEVWEQNKISSLENVNDTEVINRVWEDIKQNIRTSAIQGLGRYKLKLFKQWFDEGC
jgi:hypothetical protein